MSNENKKTDELSWFEFQKKYLDALIAFNPSSSFMNNSSPDNSFWNAAMEQWWNSMKASSPTQNENLFEKVIEQSRNYYFMGEQFSSLIDGISNFNNQKDISSFINQKFKELQSMVSQTSNQFNFGSFADAFEMPFAGMKENPLNDFFNFEGMFDGINPAMKEMRNKFLSMPGIGHSRETQEKIQELIKLGAIYQDNAAENQTVMNQLSQDALELMRKKILRMSKNGEDFNSMRQVYDLWVESNEKVYAEHAYTKEYSELNGRLVNSQMAYMKLSQEVKDDVLTAMNMPTNRAVHELERRQYELRKTVKTLEAELKSLKETVTTDKSNKKSNSDNVAKKKAVKKKATKKKAAKKKAVKKKATKKKAAKKKVAKKKTTKKKAKKKSRSTKNGVIQIKF